MPIPVSIISQLVVEPILRRINMYSPAALNLVLGTAAVESDMFHHGKQINGPALSPYGIEPVTYDDIAFRYLEQRLPLKGLVLQACGYNPKDDLPSANALMINHWLATAVCRIKYYMTPDPLPYADDIEGLAKYWKKHYNTEGGKGTVEEFIKKYHRYVRSA